MMQKHPPSLCLLLSIILFCLILPVAANAFVLPNTNTIYDPSIKTVQVFKEGFELSSPIIQLKSEEHLMLSFDDLDPDIKRFKFTIRHCESDWRTSSELTEMDVIDGFSEENIDHYEMSYNTTVKYTHYSTQFPTENMRPKISGNYLFIVYEDDTAQIAFTWRFMVVEPSPVITSGNVVQSSRMEDRDTRQQIDFIVHLNGFVVNDVGRELKIVIQQNGRWDNLLYAGRPRFQRSDELDYRYDESITFDGGNQFRNFDIKSLIYQTERIAKISYDTTNQVFLLNDLPRTFKQYVFEKDINGRFYIKNEEHADDSNIEADYAWVHFFLPYPTLLTNGQFYLLGELTQWQFNEASHLNYNSHRKGYELNLFLKQGYYNYCYVFRENNKKIGDIAFIEGNHVETENDYTIYVYYHQTGFLYDQLIAVNFLNSVQK
ncbi:MAG: DUF5103 domain-containing protein [Bacteroidales bacterium]|nr:DUF5103 domain-containing protein [Bacteroidales bacterium]